MREAAKLTASDRRLIAAMRGGEELMNPGGGYSSYTYQDPNKPQYAPLALVSEKRVDKLVAMGLIDRPHLTAEYTLTDTGNRVTEGE